MGKIISGIYEIINTINGKKYIGSTADVHTRWRKHVAELRSQRHKNKHLQAAWNKYGESIFIFNVLEECARDKERLKNREQFYFDLLKPEYNIALIAGSQLGIKRSKETKKKMSQAMKGKNTKGHKPTQETKDKIAKANTGRVASAESRKKMSKAAKIRTESYSPERIAKFAASNKGRKFPKEHKDKIARALKGRTMSNEQRIKLRIAFRGRKNPPISQKHKDAISRTHKGKVLSQETKDKISSSRKALFERLRREKEAAQQHLSWRQLTYL